jgi:hypothetical protein
MHWKDLGFVAMHWMWILLAVVALAAIEIALKNERIQRPSPQWLNMSTVFLRWLLVAVVFCIILVAIRPLRDLESMPFENKTLQSSASPSAGDAIKSNIDELKWLLTILAGFAVITAIAQAAAAWLSALTYDKQAAAKLQEIDKVLESFKSRYPVFYEVEEKRNQAHDALVATLRRVFAVADQETDPTDAISWMEDFYHELDVEERQLLLSVESFASIDLHPPRKGGEVQNLKLFAVFYHAKFRYEKGMKAAALFTDLERAEGYLLLALRKSPADFTLHNELGNIYLTMWEDAGKLPSEYPNYLEKALEAFQKSLGFQRKQQRVYYNLAYIKTVHEKDYDAARDLLMEALNYKTWQKAPCPDTLTAYIHYNLGCNRARMIVRDHQGTIGMKEAQSVISALDKASEIGQIRDEYVEIDYTDEVRGDINGLFKRADLELQGELKRVKEELIIKHTNKPQEFSEIVAEAFGMVWNSAKDFFKGKF